MDARIVTGDFGNQEIKILMSNPDGTIVEKIIPHDVLFLNEAQWNKTVQRAKNQSSRLSKSQVFQIIDRSRPEQPPISMMVGDEALRSAGSNRQLGSNKYVYHYMAGLVCAALMELFPQSEYPKGHDNIILGIGHPPSEIEHAELLISLVGGTHKVIEASGAKRKFHVSIVCTYDEPLGGFTWMQQQPIGTNGKRGDYNPMGLVNGDEVLAIDIGGFIGSIGPLVYQDGNLHPLFNDFKPINGGIVMVHDSLRENLKSLHGDLFRGMNIPTNMLSEALRTGHIVVSGGQPTDVREAITQSLHILNDVEQVYTNQFGRGRRYKHIALMGGSMRDLSDHVESILAHNSVHLVDVNPDNIILANVRGGHLITAARLIAEKRLPEVYKRVYTTA